MTLTHVRDILSFCRIGNFYVVQPFIKVGKKVIITASMPAGWGAPLPHKLTGRIDLSRTWLSCMHWPIKILCSSKLEVHFIFFNTWNPLMCEINRFSQSAFAASERQFQLKSIKWIQGLNIKNLLFVKVRPLIWLSQDFVFHARNMKFNNTLKYQCKCLFVLFTLH